MLGETSGEDGDDEVDHGDDEVDHGDDHIQVEGGRRQANASAGHVEEELVLLPSRAVTSYAALWCCSIFVLIEL